MSLNTSNCVLAELRTSRFSNTAGSTQLETNLIVFLVIFYDILAITLINFLKFCKSNYSVHIICEYFCCILLLVLSLTVLSDYVSVIYSVLFVIFILLMTLIKLRLGNSWQIIIKQTYLKDNKLPCISHFRGMVNLYSVICILCADFNSFPKRFLKTEFYGFSVMDTGVGLFVLALALGNSHIRPKQANLSAFLKHFILFFIGIGRYLSVRSVNYQHQIFEYGVHWNFFITLAVIGIFNEFLFQIIKSVRRITFFSIGLLIFYEFTLNVGLKDWIFGSAPRIDFISANREGICSVVGYEVLYLWGVIIKSYLPKKDDSYRQYVNALSVYMRTFPVLIFFTFLCDKYVGISRRCANSGYVLWISSLTLLSLSILIVFELGVLVWNRKMKILINSTVPLVVDSVNFNGLLFFLLGNFLTGLINLSMDTLSISDFWSICIITLYTFTCCSVCFFLYINKWRIC